MQIQLSTKISTQYLSTYLCYDIHGRWLVSLNPWRFHPPIPSMTTQLARWRQIACPNRPLAPNNLVYIGNGKYGNDDFYNI